MNITEVRIKLIANDSKFRAVASITIDGCFVVHDIKLIDGKDGMFISMPNKIARDGTHKDIVHPINPETRQQILSEVLSAYEKAKAEQPAE